MTWRAALARVRSLASGLDRDGALARALVLAAEADLNRDRASALTVARTLASALDLDRSRDLDQSRALAGDLVRALDRDRTLIRAALTACALASALDVALASVLDRDYVPDRTAARDLDLSRDLASALASCHALLCALANYPALDRDRDLAGDFARYRDLARCLARHCAASGAGDADGARLIPRLVRVAVRLLPRPWQSRYREEFRSDLAELPPGARSEYAWRVLANAWRLRRALAGTPCPPDGARVEG